MEGTIRPARRPSRLAVAMHEAGHAVAQLVDRDSPRLVDVRLDGLDAGLLGLVETGSLWKPHMAEVRASEAILEQWRMLAERDAVHLLAGPVAELKWRFRPSQPDLLLHGHLLAKQGFEGLAVEGLCDFAKVKRRLSWAAPSGFDASFEDVWNEAVERVVRLWPIIDRVGRELAARGELAGEEVEALCVDHPGWHAWRSRLATKRRSSETPSSPGTGA